MKLTVIAATFALLAAPVFAQTSTTTATTNANAMDPTTTSCKDLLAMDATGMATAGTQIKTAMMSDAKVSAMADADVATAAKTACTAHPDAMVADAMKM